VRDFYVLFPSTHDAMHLERLLRDLGVPFAMVPVPSLLRLGCGVALRCEEDVVNRVRELSATGHVRVKAVYLRLGTGEFILQRGERG